MNKISDIEIKNILRTRCEDIKEFLGEERLFGIFVIGKALYGFAETEDDIKTIAGYIPTKEGMYSIPSDVEYYGHHEDIGDKIINKGTTYLIDLRKLYRLFQEQDIDIMESIFSDYRIINPRYDDEYVRNILSRKEMIFKYRPYDRIWNAVERGKEALKNNDLFEASRIRIACQEYINGTSVADCIYLRKDFHLQYLQGIKTGKFIPDTHEILEDYQDCLYKAGTLPICREAEEYVKSFIKDTINKAHQDTTRVTNILEFLTDKEKQALKLILSKLNNREGVISISKLLEESDISRPVFKSTLDKIEKYCLAEITNMGVKGTKIKLLTDIDI